MFVLSATELLFKAGSDPQCEVLVKPESVDWLLNTQNVSADGTSNLVRVGFLANLLVL